MSGGGPPAPEAKPKKGKGKLVVVILLLLAVVGGGGYYLYQAGQLPFLASKATPSPTPSASPATGEFDADLKGVDTSVADVANALADTDTVLGDKQGDLSE